MNKITIENDFYFFKCPHCEQEVVVEVKELNCCIFRHAVYKHNYQQVDPHLRKDECERLVKEDKVYGCCKPFEIISKEKNLYCIKCDYK
jgi:hypothetical protein